MSKDLILNYTSNIKEDLCRQCGNTCKLNGYEPCTEVSTLNIIIDFIQQTMNEDGWKKK